MKLKDCMNWKAVHFEDRTILKADLKYLSAWQQESLQETEVKPMSTKGHYKAK